MNPTDTAEIESPQAKQESRVTEAAAPQERPVDLFQKVEEGLAGRRKSILDAFSTIEQDNSGVNLAQED